jgi:hypothetical protein
VSVPQIEEVCLVANLQTIGPSFITAAVDNIFDHSTGMLLAARIVIASGMGSQTSGLDQLHGPLPISEIERDPKLACYFYPMEMQQLIEDSEKFVTGKGSFFVCLVLKEEQKNDYRPFESMMQRVIGEHIEHIDFTETKLGEIKKENREKFKEIMEAIHQEVNQLLEFSSRFGGGSLFDIGLIATLPEKLSLTAKKILMNPKGILEEEIEDKAALRTLYQSGLLDKVEREGRVWIVPR